MKKKITIIGINYYPEDTAIGLYTSQLADYYNNQGIAVTIITGFPYYPAWKIASEYQSKKTFHKEIIGGITIYRYKQYVPKNPSFIKRILHLLDFSFGTLINIFKVKEADVVLCIVPFIGVVFLGKILSKLKKAKFWVHVQDFEFDAVSDSNIIDSKANKSWFFKLLFWIEGKLLSSADMNSTISTSMILKLADKTLPGRKTKLLPNWVDVDFINPDKFKTHDYLKSSKFKILYAGNIGEKQDWSLFLKLLEALGIEDDIEFIIVGDGSKRNWLKDELANSKNVSFYFPVTYNELSDLLCSADLHILFQKNDVIDTVMPSKILAMMASQKPSLITGNLKSEVATIISESNGGEYFDSNNVKEILTAIKKFKEDVIMNQNFGENARKYATLNFSKQEILKQFKNTFIELLK